MYHAWMAEGGGGRGPKALPLFRLGWPFHFFELSCSKEKNTPVDVLLNV